MDKNRDDTGVNRDTVCTPVFVFLFWTFNDSKIYGCNDHYVLNLFLGFFITLLHLYGLIINFVSIQYIIGFHIDLLYFCDLFTWWCLANSGMFLLRI